MPTQPARQTQPEAQENRNPLVTIDIQGNKKQKGLFGKYLEREGAADLRDRLWNKNLREGDLKELNRYRGGFDQIHQEVEWARSNISPNVIARAAEASPVFQELVSSHLPPDKAREIICDQLGAVAISNPGRFTEIKRRLFSVEREKGRQNEAFNKYSEKCEEYGVAATDVDEAKMISDRRKRTKALKKLTKKKFGLFRRAFNFVTGQGKIYAQRAMVLETKKDRLVESINRFKEMSVHVGEFLAVTADEDPDVRAAIGEALAEAKEEDSGDGSDNDDRNRRGRGPGDRERPGDGEPREPAETTPAEPTEPTGTEPAEPTPSEPEPATEEAKLEVGQTGRGKFTMEKHNRFNKRKKKKERIDQWFMLSSVDGQSVKYVVGERSKRQPTSSDLEYSFKVSYVGKPRKDGAVVAFVTLEPPYPDGDGDKGGGPDKDKGGGPDKGKDGKVSGKKKGSTELSPYAKRIEETDLQGLVDIATDASKELGSALAFLESKGIVDKGDIEKIAAALQEGDTRFALQTSLGKIGREGMAVIVKLFNSVGDVSIKTGEGVPASQLNITDVLTAALETARKDGPDQKAKSVIELAKLSGDKGGDGKPAAKDAGKGGGDKGKPSPIDVGREQAQEIAKKCDTTNDLTAAWEDSLVRLKTLKAVTDDDLDRCRTYLSRGNYQDLIEEIARLVKSNPSGRQELYLLAGLTEEYAGTEAGSRRGDIFNTLAEVSQKKEKWAQQINTGRALTGLESSNFAEVLDAVSRGKSRAKAKRNFAGEMKDKLVELAEQEMIGLRQNLEDSLRYLETAKFVDDTEMGIIRDYVNDGNYQQASEDLHAILQDYSGGKAEKFAAEYNWASYHLNIIEDMENFMANNKES